ncbi:hypothetical protein GLW08_02555 [Pontibacillus yanchengensis]|uniref:Uncharacterized protein n=2 Tax=Pontibacillus yanchengensis TaxID=462910 RepID=A0ACC7VC94_9BACI|nr:hypothetical protein [Pontibacillus yanchengensis]MYL34799.1 hypothetical protein [Pontibacillus yanchengensis]MYL52215.1 hypothetical protein [Pontibacillus yanchengensis]
MRNSLEFLLSDGHDWVVNKSHLTALGITDTHLHFVFAFMIVLLLYVLIKPIIYWVILLRWDRFASYLVSGIMTLCIVQWLELYQGIRKIGEMEFKDIASSALALILFGSGLALTHIGERLLKTWRQSKSQKPKSV